MTAGTSLTGTRSFQTTAGPSCARRSSNMFRGGFIYTPCLSSERTASGLGEVMVDKNVDIPSPRRP